MPELHYTHLLKEYISVCTEIARGAFDEDTRLHTEAEHDGPAGYDDGTRLCRMCASPDWISRAVWLDQHLIGAYSISGGMGELLYLFLHPKASGRGIGTAVWKLKRRSPKWNAG